MQANFVYEALQDILKPKSKEEVAAAYKKIETDKALELAVEHKNLEGIFDALIRGASWNKNDYYQSLEDSLLLFLSKNKRDILSDNPPKEIVSTLLKRACQNGFTELAKWALDKGANINSQDRNGSTPLYYAAKYGHFETVKFLVDNGADLEIENNEGYTPLLASLNPIQTGPNSNFVNPESVWYLIDKGADITHKLKNGSSIYVFLKGKLLDQFLQLTDLKPSDEEMIYIIHRGSIKNIKNLLDKGYLDLNKPVYMKYSKWDNKPNKPLLPIDHIKYDDGIGPGKMKFMLQNGSPFPSKTTIKAIRNQLRNSRHSYGPDDKWWKLITYFIETKQIQESVGDVLKPKDKKQIIEDLAQQMYLDLLENKALSFFEPLFSEGPHRMTPAWDTIDYSFNQYNKKYGSGLYVMSILVKEQDLNPLEHIYPVKAIYKPAGLIIYDIQRGSLETAIKELIAQVVAGIFGNGFHVKYFDPINESRYGVFKPKSVDDVVESVVNNILRDYGDHAMHFHKDEYWRDPPVKLSHHSGNGFMNQLYKKYGNVNGIYVHIEDNDPTESKGENLNLLRKYLHNLNVRYTPIGHNTIIIRDDDQERRIITKLCREVYNKVLPSIMVRKFGRPINMK